MALYAASFSPIVQTVKVLPPNNSGKDNFQTKGALAAFGEEVDIKRYGWPRRSTKHRKVYFSGDKITNDDMLNINCVYPLSEGTFFPKDEPYDAAFTVSDHADIVFSDNDTISRSFEKELTREQKEYYQKYMNETIPCGETLHCGIGEIDGKLIFIPFINLNVDSSTYADQATHYLGILKQPHFKDDPYWTVHMN